MNCLSLPAGVVVCWIAFAATVPENVTAPTEEYLQSLVEQLASPNKAPVCRGPDARYSADYDRAAQGVVWDAFKTLNRIGVDSFPVLVKHVNDNRYSSTHDNGFVDENWTVGKSCFIIMQCHVQPYGTHPYAELGKGTKSNEFNQVGRPSYAHRYGLNNAKDAANWWEARKDKPLADIQAEAIEWVIEMESRTPEEYSEEETKYLKGLLAKIRETGKALAPARPPISK